MTHRRAAYDNIVICAPVTIPYRRYSTHSAHWWLGRSLHELTRAAGITPKDIDGLTVSSFTVGPDTAIGLTQHFGLSPRWLDHIPFGGASGVVALRRAARAVQAGGAGIRPRFSRRPPTASPTRDPRRTYRPVPAYTTASASPSRPARQR